MYKELPFEKQEKMSGKNELPPQASCMDFVHLIPAMKCDSIKIKAQQRGSMKKLLFTMLIVISSTMLKADNIPCRLGDHRFAPQSFTCIYCAHGLTYDPTTLQCKGTPNVIGKCFGEDHYHARTQECMYCAKGYHFNESSRKCEKDRKLK